MMATRGEQFAGLSVAMTTPFVDGKIDGARLKEQVDFQVEAGTVCLVPTGTTGESPTLTHEEHGFVFAEECVKLEFLALTVVRLTLGRPLRER